MASSIKKVLIEEGAEAYAQTSLIMKRLDRVPVQRIKPDIEAGPDDMPPDMGKESLRLIAFKGQFLKPCPGTKDYICCGYQILNTGTNCPMDCSYCILQAYFNQPSLRLFVNLEDELERVGRIIENNPDRFFRIGTGEFTDSLALDPLTGWSRVLTGFFQGRKNSLLELKTKTDRIEGLLSSPHRDGIVVSWSLNSPEMASLEEHGAPSIRKRIEAAGRCQKEGYVTGFHFDPLIRHRDWKSGYMRTIDLLDRYLDPRRIIWISMGCFRYIPSLKPIIRRRHPKSHILDGEFINGPDGKMRYFKPIRIEIYSFIREQIEKWKEGLDGLYLCMESDEVWFESLGWSPGNSLGLSDYLDERARELI